MNYGEFSCDSIIEAARKYLPNVATYPSDYYMVEIPKPLKMPAIITMDNPGPTAPYERHILVRFYRRRYQWIFESME